MNQQGRGQQSADRRKSAARERFSRLYATMRNRICLLDYPPGMRLKEEALAAEFGTSRTPLRRVLGRLESEGLLKSVQGVGTIVTDVDIDALAQVYQLRMELSELIGKLSPVPPSRETIEIFRRLHVRSREIARKQDLRAFGQLNLDYSQAQMRLTDNEPLREICERFFHRTARIWLKSLPYIDFGREAEIFSREIGEVLAAVEIGDLEAAGHILRSHISMSFTRLRNYWRQFPPDAK